VAVDPDLLAGLEDQRRFLTRSLDDLDRELEAGDLDRDEHASLAADYRRRLKRVDAAIADGHAGLAANRRPRSLWRTAGVVVALAVVAIGLGVAVAAASGRRAPGDTVTGNDTRTENGNLLLQCLELDQQATTGEATVSDAFECYDRLYQRDGDDPVVLANFGWFLYRAGSSGNQAQAVSGGMSFVDKAIELDPDYPDAHAYRLIMLTRQGRTDEARAELATLEGLNPPPQIRQLLQPIRAQLGEPAATTTTS
jgi:cytochrome c-type biogenesis protein CcmH/NrfG